MNARWIEFGRIEIDGARYVDDVVIEAGRIDKRRKKPSKAYRDRYGHTPLSAEEHIPWGGRQLIVGTGANGSLPIMPEVYAAAEGRGIEIVALPTERALRLLGDLPEEELNAVIHVTC